MPSSVRKAKTKLATSQSTSAPRRSVRIQQRNETPRADSESNMANENIAMTQDQFEKLMATMTSVFAKQLQAQVINPQPTTSTTQTEHNGTFAKCTSRFAGKKDDCVDAFIDAITVYKDCLKISDENALKGLSMLLTGEASIWWQGLKSLTAEWKDAIDSLRHAFGRKKKAHQIYRELFQKEQTPKTPTDLFVAEARALLAKLPAPAFDESVHLDMIYGLLDRRIRKGIPREDVKTFKELLEKARSLEANFITDPKKESTSHATGNKNEEKSSRCSFCRKYGHLKDDCRKLQARSAACPTQASPPPAATPKAGPSTLRCYGCNFPGVLRSTCPNCTKAAPSTSTASVEFCSLRGDNAMSVPPPISSIPRPAINIDIFGHSGLALIDTAAKQSVIGTSLYRLLVQINHRFEQRELNIAYADGQIIPSSVLITTLDVKLMGRSIPTTFIVLPKATCNRTLLGIDFLRTAGLVIDIGRWAWTFTDANISWEPLICETDPSGAVMDLNSLELNLRDDEGCRLTETQRSTFNDLLIENADVFAERGEPTDYAEHRIDTGDHAPVFTPAYRMPPAKKEILKTELEKLLADGVIEEAESAWGSPVVLIFKKDSSVLLCIDFRKLNSISVIDRYCLPRIDDLLHEAKKTE